MPSEDDGARDDPLLSDRALAITGYRPDVAALTAAPTRVVIAVGEETINGRGSEPPAQSVCASRPPTVAGPLGRRTDRGTWQLDRQGAP